MYVEHRSFHTPDHALTIWRYIDFTKFVDLLLSRQMYFTRSDKFDDPFEGIFRLKDHQQTSILFETQALTKKYYFLNCWHVNEFQSDAMWKIFLKTNNGIAIKSTVGNVIISLESTKEEVYISKVYYRDYENTTWDDLQNEEQNKLFEGRGTSVNQFNYKRISFEHEKELRLYYIDVPIPHANKNVPDRPHLNEKRIDVDVNFLITEIVLAPFSDDWFKPLVESLIEKLDFKFKVTKSELYMLK